MNKKANNNKQVDQYWSDTKCCVPKTFTRYHFVFQDVISNLQQILVKTPPTLTSNTFVTVLHILVLMSSNGSDVGLLLLREKIGETLKRLLVADKASKSASKLACPETSSSASSSSTTSKEEMELLRRNPQELYEITRYYRNRIALIVSYTNHKRCLSGFFGEELLYLGIPRFKFFQVSSLRLILRRG